MGPIQVMPVFESRVQVDPKLTDYWGIAVARLSGHRHPDDHIVGKFLASKTEAWLKEAGKFTTWTFLPGTGLSSGQHQAGTCRLTEVFRFKLALTRAPYQDGCYFLAQIEDSARYCNNEEPDGDRLVSHFVMRSNTLTQ
jgi:hypothetical protein